VLSHSIFILCVQLLMNRSMVCTPSASVGIELGEWLLYRMVRKCRGLTPVHMHMSRILRNGCCECKILGKDNQSSNR
jgi:hypothetical protein